MKLNKAIRNLVALSLLISGCQIAPTKTFNEDANPFGTDAVLVDTRESFFYVSSHIPGSINLVTTDFLILKDPKNKRRIMDPDLEQTIERLSKKGIHPAKKVTLIADAKNSIENKKWAWLLKQLGIDSIQMLSINEFKKAHPNQRFAEPSRADVWKLQQSPEMQQEFILNKGNDCFVSFSDKKCPL